MNIPPDLRASYENTEYRVRLAGGGHAVIRIQHPLPAPLRRELPYPSATWAVITAWNPYSRRTPRQLNRLRLHQLQRQLRHHDPAVHLRGALGVGPADAAGERWREASMFVAGVEDAWLEVLLNRFKQNALVHGHGAGPAALLWTSH